MKNKILQTSEIVKKIKNLRNKKKIIGLCHGTFDLIHVGHIKHFKSSKKNTVSY